MRKYSPVNAKPWNDVFRTGFDQQYNIAFTKETKLNYWLGIIVNGLFFAWLHDPTFSIHIFTYWVMGAILAATYMNTKDLRYSFVTHMLNNTIAALPLILGMH